MSSAPIGVESFSSRCRRSASQAPPVRMPTSPVDSVAPARSFRASSSHSASASGRSIQVALQDDLSGEGVDRLLALAGAEAGFAERFFGCGRGKPLVSEFYRKPEARLEPPREAPRAPRHVVLAAIHRKRQADHQPFGWPFPLQGPQPSVAGLPVAPDGRGQEKNGGAPVCNAGTLACRIACPA